MKLKLIEKWDEAKGTKSFFWQPEKPVTWLAGQYYYFTIPKMLYPDSRGNTRHFTISSSPTEDGLIRLTTRIRQESGYKKTLDELPIGTEIEGEGPNGTFILDEKATSPNVFIAGGIGITPYRSIIKYVVDKGLSVPIHLLYSNSIPEEITFRTELEGWAKTHSNIKIDITISHPEESHEPWTGLTGRVNDTMIKKLVNDIENSVFWLCGPPAMIDAMEQVLGSLKITSDKIHSEKFTGY
jgi:ferredoxin-NADP reductase